MTVDILSSDIISPTAYLGKGLAWPPREDPNTGDFAKAEGERSVADCLLSLITTAVGEISPLQGYGTRKDELLFSVGSPAFIQAVVTSIEEAINTFERRVKYVKTDYQVISDKGPTRAVVLSITYRVISTGEMAKLTTNVQART